MEPVIYAAVARHAPDSLQQNLYVGTDKEKAISVAEEKFNAFGLDVIETGVEVWESGILREYIQVFERDNC
jgi:hypothetical protein